MNGDLRSDVGGSSLGASIMDDCGDLRRIEPVSEALVLEYRLSLQAALPLIELAREGEVERVSSGGGLDGVSTRAVESLDMPGSFILPEVGAASTLASSSSLFLYAAEPIPLSAVCLNQAGSLAANDSAICALEGSCPSSVDGSRSGVARGDRAAFSAAIMERGLRPLLDFGRCCHESVPDRDSDVVGGEAGASSAIFFGSMV
jgi:hypothetical protein